MPTTPKSRAAGAQEYTEIVSFLHDECTAYAHLAGVGAVTPRGISGPNFVPQVIMFRLKGIVLLRIKLLDPETVKDPKTLASVLLFLTTTLYEGNLEAACSHAKMIAHLL